MEIVIYAALLLALILSVQSLSHGSLDHQVVKACRDLVGLSDALGVVVSLPCSLEEGKLVYGDASTLVGSTSHGVVVEGEHWTPP